MGLSCALPTSLSEVISTQLIKKKNDNNKAKDLKQRGPVITTTNNFPKDTVKPTDDVRTENLGDGQTFTQNPCSNTLLECAHVWNDAHSQPGASG